MTDVNEVRQYVEVDKVKSEKERLEKDLYSLMVQENELCVSFANSKVGQVTELFLKNKGIQLSNISTVNLTKLINITNEISEIHRQSKCINDMIQSRTVATNEFFELSIDTLIDLEKMKKFSQNLVDLKNQKAVLEDSIKYATYNCIDQSNPNVLTEMLMEFWSDTE